jgi:hypothetical protein
MSGRVTYANGVLTFVPDGNFGDDEDVEVEVTALDLAGNRISYSVGFSTGIGVWPGDTNRDGIVNVLDLLPIGRYWHENGDPRVQEDMTWEIQPAVPWDAADATHADADGSGIVDEGDLAAIHQNWGSSHPSTTAPSITAWEREQLAHIAAESDSPGIEELRRCLAMLITPQEVPAYSSLGQNYPNPFNPETWIPYQLAKGSGVTVEIYDASGRLTRVLELGYKDAGVYTEKQRAIYWDGRNNTGEPVSSGVYFYRLKAGDFTSIRKMIVVF